MMPTQWGDLARATLHGGRGQAGRFLFRRSWAAEHYANRGNGGGGG